MRTTLTLDDDVAAELERLQRSREVSWKELVNDVLRRGLRETSARPKKRQPFQTRTFDLGKQLIHIDNTAEALAQLEGESFK
jgi:Arc/MetJ family transcription regulator